MFEFAQAVPIGLALVPESASVQTHCAPGAGADLAKESADIILTEKSLGVLHDGVVTGRRTYGNTIKVWQAQASNTATRLPHLLLLSLLRAVHQDDRVVQLW